jgi:hypothetical protein
MRTGFRIFYRNEKAEWYPSHIIVARSQPEAKSIASSLNKGQIYGTDYMVESLKGGKGSAQARPGQDFAKRVDTDTPKPQKTGIPREIEDTRLTRIYLAGPLSGPESSYLANVHRFMEAAQAIRKAGFSCFNPALDVLTGIMAAEPMTYDAYFDNNAAWVSAADAIYLMPGWEQSEGCKREKAIAEACDIPVFTKMEDLERWPR